MEKPLAHERWLWALNRTYLWVREKVFLELLLAIGGISLTAFVGTSDGSWWRFALPLAGATVPIILATVIVFIGYRVKASRRVLVFNWSLQDTMLYVLQETDFVNRTTAPTAADGYLGRENVVIRNAIELELTNRAGRNSLRRLHVRAIKQAGEAHTEVPREDISTLGFCLCNRDGADWTTGEYEGMLVKPVRKDYYRNDIFAISVQTDDMPHPNEYWRSVMFSEQEVKDQDWSDKVAISEV
ncbi:MAG: hypothetical protein HZB43_00620 [candidate division Zixibacteria bacterium]|nr:hypothetical protein [candidate division Zixibacteria bacterium]